MITLNFSGLKDYEDQPQTEPVSFKLSPAAKAKVKANAKALKVHMSEYMRAAVVTDEVFIVLNSSGSIAQGIIEAHSSLTCLLREQKGLEKGYTSLITKLNRVYSDMEALINEMPEQSIEPTSDTADTANAASAEFKNASIQFYVSTTLKAHIDTKADSLAMDSAQFLRIVALTDQPVYVLEKGHYIARYLLELYDLATGALLDSKVDNKYGQVIQRKIQDILDLFVEISKRLTNVNNIEGAAEEED